MVSREFCLNVRNNVHEVSDAVQQRKAAGSHMQPSTMLNETLDRTVAQQVELQEANARMVGCKIEFEISATSIKETCSTKECPLYPNRPAS